MFIGDFMKYLVPDYEITRDIFKDDFSNCSDFLLREAVIQDKRCFFAAMDGLIDSLQLAQMVTDPILSAKLDFTDPSEHFEQIKKSVVGSVEMNVAETFDDCYYYLMSGFALFFSTATAAPLLSVFRAGQNALPTSRQTSQLLWAQRSALSRHLMIIKLFFANG